MSSIQVLQFCAVIILYTLFVQVRGQESKESNTQYCLLNTGGIGICTNFHSCNLVNLKQEGENPALCDSENDAVFVCCPMDTPQPPLSLANTNSDINLVNTTTNYNPSTTTTIRTPDMKRMVENAELSKGNIQFCLLNTGGIGTCTNVQSCNLVNLRQEGKNPALCDSENDDGFVCCPMDAPQPPLSLASDVINSNLMNTTTNNPSTTTTIRTPEMRRMAENAELSKGTTQYCLLNTGGIGICTNFYSCNLVNLRQEGENPVICNSENDDVFVCCPMDVPQPSLSLASDVINLVNTTTNIPSTTTTIRTPEIRRMVQNAELTKSARKCMEYSKIKCSTTSSTTTIVNGVIVKSVEHYPHMALIGYENPDNPGNLTWQCGGSLISEQYILTAAHCLIGTNQTVPAVAHLGFLNRNDRNKFNTLQEFNISEIIKHPDRVDPIAYNDIALLKLDRPAIFSKSVLPACLHEEKEISVAHGQATGWGDVFSGSNLGSDDLMKVSLEILKHDNCSSLYERHINRRLRDGIREEQQFCAGGDSKDTCQGDSGGPLQIIGKDYCMHNIVGVTSFGDGCGVQPGVYTRVSHYVPWIESVVWP